MGQIKWYKRDPDAALSGMMGLSLEERGAYNTVLDLIYTRDGNLPDDDRFIAGWMGTDVRVWRRIKERLIDLGKLFVRDGRLGNSRADVEVDSALSRVGSARDAGKASAQSRARKSDRKSNENNDSRPTGVATDASTAVPTNHNHNQRDVETDVSPSPRAKRASAGTRIPSGWVPSDLPPTVADLTARWPPGRLERELEGFRDYWLARTRDAARADWDRTWHNRIRDIHERVLRDSRNGSGNHAARDDRDGYTRSLDRRLGLDGDGGPSRQAG